MVQNTHEVRLNDLSVWILRGRRGQACFAMLDDETTIVRGAEESALMTFVFGGFALPHHRI